MAVIIDSVIKKSPCGKKRFAAGDLLININGHEISDVLDYNFYIDAENPVLTFKRNNKFFITKIKKRENEDAGLQFATYLMDKQHSCKNKCIFCFIDQLPEGLRESLYFKDDDSRLSFLFGNYITLTNLTQREAERIVQMHISPVNISVHTVNPELRVKMMLNLNAGKSLRYLKYFAENKVKMNTQLVLCPGINDGEELKRSLEELGSLYPYVQSIAAVPVGLTKHRDRLPKLNSYTKESALEVIDIIDGFNRNFKEKHGETIAYAADEFYIKAELNMPDEAYYNDYPQIENGVGLWTSFKKEFMSALKENNSELKGERNVSIATGCAAYPLICELAKSAQEKYGNLNIKVFKTENRLFGNTVTVAGLLSGNDYISVLYGEDLGDELLIPAVSLKRDEDIFIDDITLDEMSQILNIKVTPVINDGYELLTALLG